jgi:transcriptional regulator with XRE-family HTH domain
MLPSRTIVATTSGVLMDTGQTFPNQLRFWRARRGLSQLELAGRAEISQRHLSFLELSRSAPSREMVTRLATALDVPLRQHNALLMAAGFAPVWRQSDLAAPELAQIAQAIDFMLGQQEPFPAVAVDRHWNLIKANAGAVRLVEWLVGPLAPGTVINLADALVAPDVLRPFLVNWTEIVRHFIRSVEADAATDGTKETAQLLSRLLAYQGVPQALKELSPQQTTAPVLPMHFSKNEVSLKLFTTIATLGTPQDITLQELRVESFFPLDDDTGAIFRDWATVDR